LALRLQIVATSAAHSSSGLPYENLITKPDGRRFEVYSVGGGGSIEFELSPKYANDLTAPSAPLGALIGKVGQNGQPFLLGANLDTYLMASGELFIGYNDIPGWGYSDNYGSYTVTVRKNP